MNTGDFVRYINICADDIMAEHDAEYIQDNMSDLCHEDADGSELVIYYAKAWDLVTLIRNTWGSLYNEAQDSRADVGSESTDLDQIMTEMAYWIVYNALCNELNNRLEDEE